jgi:hypothetical protein
MQEFVGRQYHNIASLFMPVACNQLFSGKQRQYLCHQYETGNSFPVVEADKALLLALFSIKWTTDADGDALTSLVETI